MENLENEIDNTQNNKNIKFIIILFTMCVLTGMIFGYKLNFLVQSLLIIFLFTKITIEFFKTNIEELEIINKIKTKQLLLLLFITGMLFGNFFFFIDYEIFKNISSEIIKLKIFR
jgi:hypothetical protein